MDLALKGNDGAEIVAPAATHWPLTPVLGSLTLLDGFLKLSTTNFNSFYVTTARSSIVAIHSLPIANRVS